jgi:hypothetical protein
VVRAATVAIQQRGKRLLSNKEAVFSMLSVASGYKMDKIV